MEYVYVAMPYYGCEGHAKPVAVFSTHREACVFKEGARTSSGTTVMIYKMKLDQLVDEAVEV